MVNIDDDRRLMRNNIELLEKQKAELESRIQNLQKIYNCDHNFTSPIKQEPIEQHGDVYYTLRCRRCGYEVRSIKVHIKKVARIEFPGGFVHDLDL